MKGSLRDRAFLSEKTQCGGPLEGMLRKALDAGISLHRGLIDDPGGDSLAGNFER